MTPRIIRSKRKTIALQIAVDGELIVRVPQWASTKVINTALREKALWIEKHRERALSKKSVLHKYQEGEHFWYLGEELVLQITSNYSRRLERTSNGFILSKYFQHRGQELFIAWYLDQARQIFSERAHLWATSMGIPYKTLRVTSARTRWGSCSHRSTINFSWRLILQPLWVVDYVVVHELAHIVHSNHGQLFWQLVKSTYPRYSEARASLKKAHSF